MDDKNIAFAGWLIRKHFECEEEYSEHTNGNSICIAPEKLYEQIVLSHDEIATVQQMSEFLGLSSLTVVRAIYDANMPLPIRFDSETVVASKTVLHQFLNDLLANNLRYNQNYSIPIKVKHPKSARYDIYATELIEYENIRRDPSNLFILQAQCSQCQKWITPSLFTVRKRIAYLYAGEGNQTCFRHSPKLCS